MKKFISNLKFILMPHYWVMNDPYNRIWDEELNRLLDNYEFTKKGEHTAYLGSYEIWVRNYPYACFAPMNNIGLPLRVRPSRLTILRASKKYGKLPQYKYNNQSEIYH